MKTKLLIVLIITGVAACNKDKFNTKPSLEFKSVNSQVFQKGQIMEFVLKYTDKEGDIQDSLYLEEVTKDTFCPANNFVTYYPMPADVPEQSNAQGEIVIRYIYGVSLQYPPIYTAAKCQRNDTCFFKFVLKDKANNTSDTAVSPQIVFVY